MLYLIIISIFQALFLILLLLLKKKKGIPDYTLAAYFALSALVMLLAYLEIYNRDHGYPYSFLINLSTPPIFLSGPLLWLYTSSLTRAGFRLKAVYLLHTIPFFVVLVYFSYSLYSLSSEEKILFDKTESFKNTLTYPLIIAAIALSTQGYLLWCLLILRRYRRNLKSYFSKLEDIDLKWLKFLLLSGVIFYAGISLLYALDAAFHLFKFGTLQIVGFSYVSVLILVLGFFGIRQGNIFGSVPVEIDLDQASNIQYNSSSLTDDEEQFVHRLINHMKTEKPYTDCELTLAKLSSQLGVNAGYLSDILNSRLNMNYFDFVNHHRIEEFKLACREPQSQKLTILGIAFNCGFNSKATFNRVFKKVVGLTPGEYLQKVSKN